MRKFSQKRKEFTRVNETNQLTEKKRLKSLLPFHHPFNLRQRNIFAEEIRYSTKMLAHSYRFVQWTLNNVFLPTANARKNSLHILTNGTFICALDRMSLRFGNANAKASITKAINQNKSPPVIALSIFGWQKNDPSMTIRLFHSQVFHWLFLYLSLSLRRIWLWFSFIFRCIHLTWIIIIKEKFILILERTTNIFNWLQSHLQSKIWFTSWTMEIIKKDLTIGFDDQSSKIAFTQYFEWFH